jgi:predicted ATPase
MINLLQIVNFKSHKDTTVHLKNLTVFCGENGVGKSSLIQSLLLLKQTHNKSKLHEHLSLNKPLCDIGKTKDALYEFNDGDNKNEIAFVITDENLEYSWIFDASKEYDFLNRKNDIDDSSGYEKLSLFSNNFQYVSAARLAEYKSNDYEVLSNKQVSVELGKGELTAHFLYQYQKDLKVNEVLLHPSETDPYLLSQITAWEREISKGVNILPQKVGESYEIKYSFDVPDYGKTQEFSTSNVGFGLSYTLPILVAILSAKNDALIIIENPEAHLHPNGIAKLTELICLAAQAGIQIILETHSDHIINGILVQCKKFEQSKKGIDRNNVSIYQFDRDEKEHCTKAIKIEIEGDGLIRYPPKGFFDQFSIDRRFLLDF